MALRPLDINVGAEKRSKTAQGRDNGYRQKTQMIRLSYSKRSPQKKIRKIADKEMRKKTRIAFKYLMAAEASSYNKFAAMREKFKARNKHPDDRQRLRWANFIEEVGL